MSVQKFVYVNGKLRQADFIVCPRCRGVGLVRVLFFWMRPCPQCDCMGEIPILARQESK